jgi:hypothetical protein
MRRPSHVGSPEGTRANFPPRRGMRTASLGVILLLCAGFAVAIGDDTARLTVKNQTAHVLTIVVADKTYPAVAAGAAITYTSGDTATVAVDVSYAAGQGIDGSARRSFHLEHAHPSTGQGSYTYFACVYNGGITSPAIFGPVQWTVTADTLAVR